MPFWRAGSTPVPGTITLKTKTMEELKERLAALGIGDDKIDGVIETVLGFVKDKLPDGMEGMFDSVLKGEVPDLGDDLLEKAKGLFGG